MKQLHGLDHCPRFAHDVLEIIHDGLLVPDRKKRWECTEVVNRLKSILTECQQNEAYCLAPERWRGDEIERLVVWVWLPQLCHARRWPELTLPSVCQNTVPHTGLCRKWFKAKLRMGDGPGPRLQPAGIPPLRQHPRTLAGVHIPRLLLAAGIRKAQERRKATGKRQLYSCHGF